MHSISLFVALFILSVAPPVQAQCDTPLIGPEARYTEGRKPEVDVGFAVEDWQWRFATGRAVLGTMVPLAVAGTGHRIGRTGVPALRTASLILLGTGTIVGPSLGQWSLGGRCVRQSILPTLLRIGGVAEVTWAAHRTLGEGGAPVRLLYAIPGLVAGVVGISWAIGATPRIAVDEDERRDRSGPFDAFSVHLGPVSSSQGQAGIQLRVRW